MSLSKGQTLDFVVGGRTPAGGAWYCRWNDNTTLAATITSSDGKTYDLAADFSNSKNPNGAWSYGWLAAGAAPDASTFKPYAKCEAEKYDVIGGICNPGSDRWEDVLADTHYYPRVPHRELEIARLRTFAGNDNPQFLSEYGIGSASDLPRFLRHYEQAGCEQCELAGDVRGKLAAFMDAWERLKLDDTFASPEDFFRQCVAKMAGLKRMGINAIRSNPKIVGYGMTGCNDPVAYGEGFITHFRELKPGATDAIFDGFYPVRWCTFAEPVSVYRGAKVHLEAVLSNDDAVTPGQYPARVEVVGPNNERVFRKTITVTIPEAKDGKEPPLRRPGVLRRSADRRADGQVSVAGDVREGRCRGRRRGGVLRDRSGRHAGGRRRGGRLGQRSGTVASGSGSTASRLSPTRPGKSNARQVILVSNAAGGEMPVAAWRDLAQRIAEGSTAVFLSLDVSEEGRQSAWLAAACQQGDDGDDLRVQLPAGLPEGRMGEEASAVRRPALRRADGLHVLSRDDSGQSLLGPGHSRGAGGRRDSHFDRRAMPFGTDALGLQPRRGPVHPQLASGAAGIGPGSDGGATAEEHAPLRCSRLGQAGC